MPPSGLAPTRKISIRASWRQVGARCRHLWVLLTYVVLSLAMTWPLPRYLGTQFAGQHLDARVFQWNNWWVKQALLQRLDLNHPDYIYYPSGASLSSHNLNWVSSFLSVPLSLLWGPVVAYNLTFLLTFVLAAFGMYLLVYDRVRRRDAAWIAGLVFAFFPYHVSGNWDGQMNLANIQWLPLFILFFLRTVDGKRGRDAVLAGLFLGLASLDCWFFAVFLAVWGSVWVLVSLILERDRWTWRLVWLLLGMAVVAGLLIGPFLWPVIADVRKGAVQQAMGYYEEKATDLLAYVTPSSLHPLWGRWVAPIYARFAHWRPAFLGYAALLLAAYGAWAARRSSPIWLVSGLLFAVLALGSQLEVNGVAHLGIPMPFGWLIALFPPLKIIRQASRFNVMVALSLAVLVGLGCADLLGRLERRRAGHLSAWARPAAVVLLGAWILFEYLAAPCPALPSQVSPFYQALARQEGDWAILELPLDDFYSRRSLYAQTVHHKKLVNGYLARVPADAHAFIDGNALLKALRIQMEVDPELHAVPAEIGVLAANNIRYVVIQKLPLPNHPAVPDDIQSSWRALFGPVPEYEDAEIAVYRLPSDPPMPPLYRFGGQLALVSVRSQRARLLDDPFLTIDLQWVALANLQRAYRCELRLATAAGTVAGATADAVSPRYPTDRWPAGVAVRERYAIPLDPALSPGAYTLDVTVTDAGSGQELGTFDHSMEIGDVATPWTAALDGLQFPVRTTFGDQMRLLGYTPRQEGDRLTLTMYWQAVHTMQVDYKMFVHLVRPGDGTIAAQHDWMPRDWSYPTSLWDRWEIFVDQVSLDLVQVEPGPYRLAVGVYEPEGTSLRAVDAAGRSIPDGRAILGQAVYSPPAIEVHAP